MQKKQIKKLILILAAVLLLAFLVPQHFARADLLGIGDFAATAVNNIIYFALYAIFQAVGSILGFFANLLDSFIRFMSGDYPDAVRSSWEIIRNFANMIFILALIVMAFGTIFDVQKYSWRNMLAPFLIAALLINFSFVIGTYLISVADGLSGVFLRQIGNASERLMNGLALGNITFNGQSIAALDAASATLALITGLIFINVFAVIAMLAMAAAAIFAIVRIAFLWFLLILSPIAWIGYIFPNLRGQTWSEWWKQFFCWCFFLPYYLFFLSFAFIFISAKPKLAGNVNLASANVGGILGGLFNFNDILFYIITILFMVGGLFIARKLSCMTGTGVGKVFGKIEGGVRKYAPGAAYVRGAWGGLKERGEQIKEKGALGIGGAQRTHIAEAEMKGWVAGIPGLGRVPGAKEEADRTRLEEINKKEAPKLALELQRLSADERKEFLQKEQGRKGIAGEAVLLEYVKQGYSTLPDYKKAMDKFGGENTVLGRQYLENLKQAKLSDLFQGPDQELDIARGKTPDGKALDTERFSELRRALFMDLAKRNRINNIDDYEKAKTLLKSTPAEWKSFIDAIKPEYIFGDKDKRAKALLNSDKEIGDTDLAKKLVDYMSDKDRKEIADYKDASGNITPGWQLREAALKIVGGKDSLDGKTIINTINKYNPLINIEADVRVSKSDPTEDLNDSEKVFIKKYAIDELLKKTPEDAAKLSSDFFSNELTIDALENALYLDPEEPITEEYIEALIKTAPPKTRKVLRQILPEQKKNK